MFNSNKDHARPDGARPWWLRSLFWRRSRATAADYLGDRDKLDGLVNQASVKAGRNKPGLREVWRSLPAFFRLVRAYANGSYRQVSGQALLTVLAALVYFVSPIDLVPDFILGLGLVDDATILAWTVRACAADIAAFLAWESAAGKRRP